MIRPTLIAIGRIPAAAAERSLLEEYLLQFAQTGRKLGLGAVIETEIDERRAKGMAAEAVAIRAAIPQGAVRVMLDERGEALTSPELARRLAGWRDAGHTPAFVIGGADGIAPDLRAEADLAISFGRMVWPHRLARVMLAEQLYRAATILAGLPYHRV